MAECGVSRHKVAISHESIMSCAILDAAQVLGGSDCFLCAGTVGG